MAKNMTVTKKEIKSKKNVIFAVGGIILTLIVLGILNSVLDSYQMRVINLCGIYITLALSMTLVNGFLGLFSLGHAGFMAVGAYTCALLTMAPEQKAMNFFLKPIVPWLAEVQWSLPAAILMSGILAAAAGALIGAPVLRLKDDYLAIATLGFAEIIRIIFTNTQTLTNGSLGIKGIPSMTKEFTVGGATFTIDAMWWIWGIALITIVFMFMLSRGSYGKAFKAIREDEIAAEAMGIGLFKHKMLAFVIGSFFAGVGGALLGNIMGTIDPFMFRFTLTYNVVMIVVLGGIGSISGGIISAIAVTIFMEVLRFLDSTFYIGSFQINSIPGVRMVVFSALLMAVILFWPRGLMGNDELSLTRIRDKIQRKLRLKKPDGKGVK